MAANIAKLPVLLRPQSDSGTAESGRCQAFSRSFELGYFDFGFRKLDAAGMLSCTPKNKSACANSDERGCQILRGSHRSAKFGLAPNCFGQTM
jgi:hypothetical protein